MSIISLLIPFSRFDVEQLEASQEGIVLSIRSTTEDGSCPACQTSSSRVHSCYQRTLKDLPVCEIPLTLHLQIRRFFCDNPNCERKTFAEVVRELALPFARKTVRLTEQLRHLGFAAGAEGGAHVAAEQKIACSADTILRLMRKTKIPPHATPTHLGVDDWAFRRNVTYGTILVDLQDHHVIDLLPDRAATTLETWLKAHPGVDLISRDRAGEYATGARKGAPKAVQVADRFHIQKNLGKQWNASSVVIRSLCITLSWLALLPLHLGFLPPFPARSEKRAACARVTSACSAIQQCENCICKVPVSETIARRFHMGRMTVQKFAYAETYPETAPYRARANVRASL